jgi:integrase
MRGHIRERSPGRWAIIIDIRDPETGERRRKWHSFKGTKRQAQMECSRLISERQAGTYVDPSRETVAAFLDRWIEHMKGQVAPRSHERYAEIARKNIAPLLGAMALTKVQPAHISAAYAKALTSGHRKGRGGLSPRTVHHMHRILKQALKQAVCWQLLVRNPADVVKPPKVERRPVAVINADETASVLEEARQQGLLIPMLLGGPCGMRRGEIAALRWHSLDLDRAQLSVVASTEQTKAGCREKEAKSSKCRTIALPAFVVDELRRHHLQQAEQLLRLGVRLTDDHHVIMQADGSPLQPNSLTHAVTLFMKARGHKVRLHGLRHSHASHLLAANVHPKIVQERLGHSSIAITMDIYSHLMPNMQSEAAARVDEVMQAALNRRRNAKG